MLDPRQFRVEIIHRDDNYIDAFVLDSSLNHRRRQFAVTIPREGPPEGWIMRSETDESEFHECAKLPRKLLDVFVSLVRQAADKPQDRNLKP